MNAAEHVAKAEAILAGVEKFMEGIKGNSLDLAISIACAQAHAQVALVLTTANPGLTVDLLNAQARRG